MDSFLSHLDCRIQVVGRSEAAFGLGTRLDASLQQSLGKAFGTALDQATEGDPKVYVLRRVDLKMSVILPHGADTGIFLEQMGGRMAGAALRQAFTGDDAETAVAQFDDQADYLAHFIADLLDRRAWSTWLYGPFRKLKGMPLKEALRCALSEEPQYLPGTMSRLASLGRLESLLMALDPTTADELWRGLGEIAGAIAARDGTNEVDTNVALQIWRPFYAAALGLLDRLELWKRQPPDLEELLPGLQSWERSGTGSWRSENEQRSPEGRFIDWRDRQSLADALLAVVSVLARLGYVKPPHANPTQAEFNLELDTVLLPLDWLDVSYLKRELVRELDELLQAKDNLPLRPRPPAATPRQSRLLADLLEALRARGINLDRQQPNSASNALRLLALLGERNPEWVVSSAQGQADPFVRWMIAALLAAWEALVYAYEPDLILEALLRGNLSESLRLLPQTWQPKAEKPFSMLLGMGSQAVRVLTEVSKIPSSAVFYDTILETGYAGVALLSRVVLEAHLPALLAKASKVMLSLAVDPKVRETAMKIIALEQLQNLLLELFQVWAGEQPKNENETQRDDTRSDDAGAVHPPYRLDSGLLLLAGYNLDSDQPLIPQPPAFDYSGFQPLWEQALAGLRMDSTGILADDLLRLWSRWLRGFADSSIPYLLENFIRRPGMLRLNPTELLVELEPRPLDIVLEIAGYLEPIENIPWLAGRKITFRIR